MYLLKDLICNIFYALSALKSFIVCFSYYYHKYFEIRGSKEISLMWETCLFLLKCLLKEMRDAFG